MIINPYILLTPSLLDAMLKQPVYFVRQYYKRGLTEEDNKKVPLLFSHYSHHEIDSERARRHMRVLWSDRLRFLYDSTDQLHLEKLKYAAGQPKGFKIYTNVLMKDWTPPRHIRNNVYQYLKNKFSFWPGFRNDNIKIQLKDLFGEFYLVLSWRGTKVEVLLEEIETFHNYVL